MIRRVGAIIGGGMYALDPSRELHKESGEEKEIVARFDL
jgi:hypothetical protein